MSKQGSSTALILVATAFFMLLAGCETSKHSEIMGDEAFAAKKRAEQMQASESGGIPLGGEGLSQDPITGLPPEGPPGATLRGLDRGAAVGEGEAMISGVEPEVPETVSPEPPPVPEPFTEGERSPAAGFAPEAPSMPSLGETAAKEPEKTFEPGPTGYEGRELESPTSPPSGFMPSAPPMPTFGQEPSAEPETPEPETPEPMVEAPPEVEPSPPTTTEPEVIEVAPVPIKEIADVFFDFDKYAIRSDAAATLFQNARILQNEHQGTNVLIEGHCDERGTEEYNMVLGERRAQAVKNYLVDLGVPASNIQIVSYGKDRPFCTEHYDACWDLNRRGHFVLQ